MPIATKMEILSSAPRVWSILTDTHLWPVWGPSVTRVESTTRFITADSRGRVRTAVGLWLPFEITGFDDGRFWTWRVAGMRATGHRVEALGDDRCRLSFEVPAAIAPYLVVCGIACRRIRALANTRS